MCLQQQKLCTQQSPVSDDKQQTHSRHATDTQQTHSRCAQALSISATVIVSSTGGHRPESMHMSTMNCCNREEEAKHTCFTLVRTRKIHPFPIRCSLHQSTQANDKKVNSIQLQQQQEDPCWLTVTAPKITSSKCTNAQTSSSLLLMSWQSMVNTTCKYHKELHTPP